MVFHITTLEMTENLSLSYHFHFLFISFFFCWLQSRDRTTKKLKIIIPHVLRFEFLKTNANGILNETDRSFFLPLTSLNRFRMCNSTWEICKNLYQKNIYIKVIYSVYTNRTCYNRQAYNKMSFLSIYETINQFWITREPFVFAMESLSPHPWLLHISYNKKLTPLQYFFWKT